VFAKNKFVADGPRRFLRGKEAAVSESIEKKYAAGLAKAGPRRKLQIRARMMVEYLRCGKSSGHQPSAATLW
jgi:hypothetical protein